MRAGSSANEIQSMCCPDVRRQALPLAVDRAQSPFYMHTEHITLKTRVGELVIE